MEQFGKLILSIGILLVVLGIFFYFGGKLFGLGRLPGDIIIEREHGSFYFPIVSCIILSIILSVIFSLLGR